MKKLFLVLSLVFVFSIPALAQCPRVPHGFLCITQEAGNKAAENARVVAAQEQEIAVLKSSLVTKDAEIFDIRKTANDNINKLEAAIHETENKLAEKTGALIESRADKVMYQALIEFLAKNQKSKQNGVINFKLGGN